MGHEKMRTLVLLKPDCVLRGLIGEVISMFEKKGLKIVGMKMLNLDEKTIEKFYSHHKNKEFFPRLVNFMKSAPVVAIVLEGKNVVEVVRKMCGVTTGREADPGTIRGRFSMSTRYNIIHVSDSDEKAEEEIGLFFNDGEIFDYEKPFIYCEEEIEELKKEKTKIKKLKKIRKIPYRE